MDLLTLNDIQRQLIAQYEALGGEVPELNMKDATVGSSAVTDLESQLGASFPLQFRDLVQRYDLGRLNIGGVFFGQKGDYLAEMRSWNGGNPFPAWWGEKTTRPERFLRVAGTDGYIVLLDCTDGTVSSFLRSACCLDATRIASDFALLIRGAGTVHFARRRAPDKEQMGREVARACGAELASEFWEELAIGIA